MKVSYQWLKDYLGEQLPSPEETEELLTFHSFEIEERRASGDDTIIDVDVLPNRSSDCLSHRGIAYELGAILGVEIKHDALSELPAYDVSKELEIKVEDAQLCSRYSALVIKGVHVKASPKWLQDRLQKLGQKSINNVVDVTNYVMLDLGQPLHAFDKNKIGQKNGVHIIGVRPASKSERMKALDEIEYTFESELLITDASNDSPIGIAGIKGGKHAEVTSQTVDLVLEAAHFNPTNIRKSARSLKLRTEASWRFENNPSPELTLYALKEAAERIQELAGGSIEGCVDFYPRPPETQEILVTVDETNKLLGTNLKEKDVENILKRLRFRYTKRRGNFAVKSPFERTDLNLPEDIVEEIGRMHGYRNLDARALPSFEKHPEVNKRVYYEQKVRRALSEAGFSEVYTYTLQREGEVEIENPFASDKRFLRASLAKGLQDSLDLNGKNAPLLGLDAVKIFEIGTVFRKSGEYVELGVGTTALTTEGKNVGGTLQEAREVLSEVLGKEVKGESADGVFTLNFDDAIKDLPEQKSYDQSTMIYHSGKEVRYRPISHYPFALRDLALWVPKTVSSEEVSERIRKASGELLVNLSLFDTFEKNDEISYAFHLVFQSSKQTLSESALTDLMGKITNMLGEREGWKVR